MSNLINNLKKLETINVTDNMPLVQPIPLITKNKSIFSKIKLLFKSRQWQLNKNFMIKITDDQWLFVPAPFNFDFASVPKLFHSFLDPTGVLLVGSVFHDFGYRFNGLLTLENDELIFTKYSKKEIDRIFRLVTEKVNNMTTTAFIAESAVKIGGYFAWKEN